ncbi:MAG: hypothetical protein ABI921_14700 [Panacibacter sp.]
MAKTMKPAQPATASKKTFREDIEKKLETALAELKTELGDKKFKNRMKKVSKILTHGHKGTTDKTPAIKKSAKAPAAKKTAKTTVKKSAKKVAVK